MVDPATATGLVLGVVPLIISALENYESIIQPVKIFTSTYRDEVERFRNQLKIEQSRFREECKWLLKTVLASDQPQIMIKNTQHFLWQDQQNLEAELRVRLNENYEACEAALHSIIDVQARILKDTKDIDILMKERPPGHSHSEWHHLGKRLKQRYKISFCRKRFGAQLDELRKHNNSLRKTRKNVDAIKTSRDLPAATVPRSIDHFQAFKYASHKLYDALSSVWRCDEPRDHFANVSLEDRPGQHAQESYLFRFDLAWMCPIQHQSSANGTTTLRLSVDAYQESVSGAISTAQNIDSQHRLEDALRLAIRSQGSSNARNSPTDLISRVVAPASLPDLYKIPNLCQHLGQQLGSSNSPPCVGFLQKTKTFKHLIYIPDHCPSGAAKVQTLEEILADAKARSKPIPIADKIALSRSLAAAVLQYHSTPWLKQEWRSEDIVFFGVGDHSIRRLRSPYLKTPYLRTTVSTHSAVKIAKATASPKITGSINSSSQRTIIRNQTLFNLGVMFVEIAYNAPLDELKLPQDEKGDGHSSYWAAERLAPPIEDTHGPGYREIVEMCLYCSFGPAYDLDDPRLQESFFREVVQRLAGLRLY